jgi:hypothetical protein
LVGLGVAGTEVSVAFELPPKLHARPTTSMTTTSPSKGLKGLLFIVFSSFGNYHWMM